MGDGKARSKRGSHQRFRRVYYEAPSGELRIASLPMHPFKCQIVHDEPLDDELERQWAKIDTQALENFDPKNPQPFPQMIDALVLAARDSRGKRYVDNLLVGMVLHGTQHLQFVEDQTLPAATGFDEPVPGFAAVLQELRIKKFPKRHPSQSSIKMVCKDKNIEVSWQCTGEAGKRVIDLTWQESADQAD